MGSKSDRDPAHDFLKKDPSSSGGGPVHAHVPMHAHSEISPKQSQLHNKLPMYMYMINLRIIYVVVNIFSRKNNKSLRKLRVGVNRYMGVKWSTTTSICAILLTNGHKNNTSLVEIMCVPIKYNSFTTF